MFGTRVRDIYQSRNLAPVVNRRRTSHISRIMQFRLVQRRELVLFPFFPISRKVALLGNVAFRLDGLRRLQNLDVEREHSVQLDPAHTQTQVPGGVGSRLHNPEEAGKSNGAVDIEGGWTNCWKTTMGHRHGDSPSPNVLLRVVSPRCERKVCQNLRSFDPVRQRSNKT